MAALAQKQAIGRELKGSETLFFKCLVGDSTIQNSCACKMNDVLHQKEN